jgi:hypothetical protein
MFTDITAIEHLTERIIGCAIEVHKTLGAGLLKLSDCPAGLLLNFNVTVMKTGVNRLDHPDLYTPKKKEFFS